MSIELIQNSPEWVAARVGSWGASEMGDLMAKGEGKTRLALIRRKAAERMSGVPQGWEGNAATEDGHRQEELAVAAYEARTNSFVQRVGLIKHPRIPTAHASPDGIADGVCGLEIKSHVKLVTHLSAIEAPISKDHMLQMQWGMACTGLPEWEYGHFCEQAPKHLQLFLFPRVKRDEAVIASLVVAVQTAEQEVLALIEKYAAKAA